MPAFASAMSYYDGYRSARLPANLLQAQRDYFGAHTYERTDMPAGRFFQEMIAGRSGGGLDPLAGSRRQAVHGDAARLAFHSQPAAQLHDELLVGVGVGPQLVV